MTACDGSVEALGWEGLPGARSPLSSCLGHAPWLLPAAAICWCCSWSVRVDAGITLLGRRCVYLPVVTATRATRTSGLGPFAREPVAALLLAL